MQLTERDKLIIATALSLCPVARLGDRIGSSDAETAKDLVRIAAKFDKDIADEMSIFVHQFT